MCIIMDVLSLKVIAPNLLDAVSVLNVNPRKLNQRKITHSSLLNKPTCSLTRINLYLIYTVKTKQCYFIFNYSVSVPGHRQT